MYWEERELPTLSMTREYTLSSISPEFMRVLTINQKALNNIHENYIMFICNPSDKQCLEDMVKGIDYEIFIVTRPYIRTGEVIQITDSEIKTEIIEHMKEGFM